jgi:hypothetical protein
MDPWIYSGVITANRHTDEERNKLKDSLNISLFISMKTRRNIIQMNPLSYWKYSGFGVESRTKMLDL